MPWRDVGDHPNSDAVLQHRHKQLTRAASTFSGGRIGVLKRFAKDQKVLDVGCVSHNFGYASGGKGRWLHQHIVDAAAECVGTDYDEVGIKEMREAGYDVVHADITGDLSPLLERGPFDVVVAGEIIEHLPSPSCCSPAPASCSGPAGSSSSPHRTRSPRAGCAPAPSGSPGNRRSHPLRVPDRHVECADRTGLVLTRFGTVGWPGQGSGARLMAESVREPAPGGRRAGARRARQRRAVAGSACRSRCTGSRRWTCCCTRCADAAGCWARPRSTCSSVPRGLSAPSCRHLSRRTAPGPRPAGVLPQAAERLDADPALWADEVRIRVETPQPRCRLVPAAGDQARRDGDAVRAEVLDIVGERGKMQNPVTGSGGMLVGTVDEVGPDSPLGLLVGDRVATLVSLSLTPLRINDDLRRWDGRSEQVPCDGTAILFGRSIAAVLPDDLPAPLAMMVMDVCGAPALVRRVVRAMPTAATRRPSS